MAASGDERDMFRYGHRLYAANDAWMEWAASRARRRNMGAGFAWNQVLIIGDYGVGKTTLGIYAALKEFLRGHPVFSNASALFGWRLPGERMYTALGRVPKHSFLLIDEGSAHLSSKMGGGVAVSTFSDMSLNTRKQNAFVIYMSAQDWEIATSIRHNCKEVWMRGQQGRRAQRRPPGRPFQLPPRMARLG